MSNQHVTHTISLSTALLILFVALKLTHEVDWSWAVVLSPLWFPIAAAAGAVVGIGVALAVVWPFAALLDWKSRRRNREKARRARLGL